MWKCLDGGRKEGRKEGWKEGRMEGWKDGRMEGWKVGRPSSVRSSWKRLAAVTL